MPGQIVHTEIPADDTSQGTAFWGSLFGWEFQSYPGGPSDYLMARVGENGGVALTNMEPGKRGMRNYFDVDDIDSGIERVKELGGEADQKMPVPTMGWFAVCRDPHGNEFGLWENDAEAPAPAA